MKTNFDTITGCGGELDGDRYIERQIAIHISSFLIGKPRGDSTRVHWTLALRNSARLRHPKLTRVAQKGSSKSAKLSVPRTNQSDDDNSYSRSSSTFKDLAVLVELNGCSKGRVCACKSMDRRIQEPPIF